MPYTHEIANQIGFLEILEPESSEWIRSRLKTYGKKQLNDTTSYKDLKTIEVAQLPKSLSFSKAVAIDGSLATIENPSITVLKIASVWADLTCEPSYVNGVLNPESLARKYTSEFSIGLIPGKDVYPKDKIGSWDSKLREEFYQTLRHITSHRSSRNLNMVAFLRGVLKERLKISSLKCPNCSAPKVDFVDSNFETICDSCGVEVYLTDFLSGSLFAVGGSGTTPMLICEQILLQSILSEVAKGNVKDHNLKNTLFIADGPLRFYKLRDLSEIVLSDLRNMETKPALVAFMKTGHVEKIFESQAAKDSLAPGRVAIITEEMRGSKPGSYESQANSGLYGKSFAYRTLDGEKRFGFMLPPMRGDLHEGGAPVLDDWSSYPHLRAICEFIETNKSNENGPNVASLEIIGRANYAASLPRNLSKRAISELTLGIL